MLPYPGSLGHGMKGNSPVSIEQSIDMHNSKQRPESQGLSSTQTMKTTVQHKEED
jgi:hypothetical protein